MSAFSFFAAWALLILMLAILAQTAWGKPIVYYTLWLMIVFMLITHANEIGSILANTGLVQQDQGTVGAVTTASPPSSELIVPIGTQTGN